MQKSKLQQIWRSNGEHGGTHYLTTPPLPRSCLLRGWGKKVRRRERSRTVGGRQKNGMGAGWLRFTEGAKKSACEWQKRLAALQIVQRVKRICSNSLLRVRRKRNRGGGQKLWATVLNRIKPRHPLCPWEVDCFDPLIEKPQNGPQTGDNPGLQPHSSAWSVSLRPIVGLGGGGNGSKTIQNVAGIHQLPLTNAEMKHFEHVCWLYFNENKIVTVNNW